MKEMEGSVTRKIIYSGPPLRLPMVRSFPRDHHLRLAQVVVAVPGRLL
jgi:hypothetical protein